MKYIIKLGIILSVLGSIQSQSLAAELFNRVVAYVDNEIITIHELDRKIQELTGYAPEELKRRDPEKYMQTRHEVLDFLIEEKLTQAKVKELGIIVTEKQVEVAIENIKKDYNWTQEDFYTELKKRGLSYEKYVVNVKKELERARLIEYEVKSKILIKEEKMQQYYQDHLNEFKSDDKVHLAGIFLVRENPDTEEKKQQLKEKIEEIQKKVIKGADFFELAKTYSQGPGAESGGDLGIFKVSQLDSELQRLLEGMVEGEVGGPIISVSGFQLIKLINREKGRIKTFEELRDAISDILYRQEIDMRYMSWIKDLKANSYLKIVF